MALLHHVETMTVAPRRTAITLNWRLMLALGGTALFWIGVAKIVSVLLT